jgi:hypothetical protein
MGNEALCQEVEGPKDIVFTWQVSETERVISGLANERKGNAFTWSGA